MRLTLALILVASTLQAAPYDWFSATVGGNYSTTTNWSPTSAAGGPGSADIATLIDATANRVITVDASAAATLGTLNFNQTSAFTSTLDIQRGFTITNAVTLGAAAGTERISFNTGNVPTATIALTTTGGITLNAGGELQLTAYRQSSTGTVFFGDVTGSVTVAGGTLTIRATENNAAANTATSASNTISSNLTMTSGALVIDNSAGLADRRLSVSGSLNITGGSVSSTLVGANGTLFLTGATNVLNPASFDTDINTTLGASSAQSFSTSVTLGSITLRGTGVKTMTSSAAGNGIGQIQLIDGNNGTASSATTLRLGSNLTLSAGAGQPVAANFSQTVETGTNRTDFGIDTNGFTLDLSAGASSGVWTPNIGATGNVPTWSISGSGAIRANAFTLSNASVTTNIASGTTLLAVGTTSVNNLGSAGTINANSTFTYAGAATTATPATITAGRSIGNLTISSGALRVVTSALVAGGLTTIDTGATLDLSSFGLTTNGLTVNNGAITTPANLTITGSGANVLKTGASTLVLSNTANSYTGTTTVQDGILQFAGSVPVSSNSALGNASSDIIVGTTSSTGGQRIQLLGTTAGTVSRNINATGGTYVATDPASANRIRIGASITGGGTLTYDGTLTWGASGSVLAVLRTLELTSVQANTTTVFNGLIASAAGSAGILINGGASGIGSVRLANAGNTFTNSINVVQGTLLVGGNAPASGASVLGNGGAIGLSDGGTPAANWTIASNNLNSGDAGNPAILTDGAFTVARAINLNNAATFSGGPAPAVTGNGSPNSYIIGGNTANASTFSGNVTVSTNAGADKLLRLSQVASGTVTLSGVINPNADATRVLNVEKVGAGTVILTAANTYDGSTTVSAGTLLINNTTGSGTGTGAVSVIASTILGGTGILSPTGSNGISVAGSLAPGTPGTNNDVGTLTFTPASADTVFTSTSTADFELSTNGTHGYTVTFNADNTINTLTGTYISGGNDRLVFNGGASANKLDFSNLATGNFNLTFAAGYTAMLRDVFDLLDWSNLSGTGTLNNQASAITGLSITQLDLPSLSGGLVWDTTRFVSHGVIGIAPEPSRALLLMLGLCPVLLRRRRAYSRRTT